VTVARCKVYEIRGPDPSRTAGALRCTRDVVRRRRLDGKKFPLCKHHDRKKWGLFVRESWLYAVDLNSKAVKKKGASCAVTANRRVLDDPRAGQQHGRNPIRWATGGAGD
jgi:hypothetical protein